MIAYIKGKLTYKSPTVVVIEQNGMGYQINISLNTYDTIQSQDECLLYTYLNLKKEGQVLSAFELYGFAEKIEKHIFENLISISGIGANTARTMLSSYKPEEVQQAIINGDVAMIKSIKGIGQKTAERVVLELKDKLGKSPEKTAAFSPDSYNTYRQEALSALSALGFSKKEGEKAMENALRSADKKEISAEELIKLALKNM